jgi:hypothetical protein
MQHPIQRQTQSLDQRLFLVSTKSLLKGFHQVLVTLESVKTSIHFLADDLTPEFNEL